jgi:hypothetical protein
MPVSVIGVLKTVMQNIQNNLNDTAGDYLYERLVDLGLIKNNSNFTW